MEGVKGRGRSFKKHQSRRQTAMHNLVRNRWDAVYWNIHYNFSPFSLFLSPNCVSRGETRLPSTLANPTTTGNLWFTISTEHHPRLRFGLRPDISSLEAFFLFLFFFFRVIMDRTLSPPTDVVDIVVEISFRFKYFRHIITFMLLEILLCPR